MDLYLIYEDILAERLVDGWIMRAYWMDLGTIKHFAYDLLFMEDTT